LLMKKGEGEESGFNLELKLPGTINIEQTGMQIKAKYVDGKEFGDPNCVYIDADRISSSLRIRNRKNGDRFRPLGMKGKKKLKDFFIDEKIPRYLRDEIALVVDGDTIVWVVGYQISDDYKITKQTRNVIELLAID